MKIKSMWTLAIVAITTFTSAMFAQEQRTQEDRQNKQTQPTKSSMSAPTLPQVLASKLMLGNHCEIHQARLAVERAQNPEVREFAQLMINEHTKSSESLKSQVPPEFVREMMTFDQSRAGQSKSDSTRSDLAGNRSAQDQQSTEKRRVDQTETVNRDRPVGSDSSLLHQLCEIEKSAAMKKSEAMHKMLTEHESSDFDMAFVGSQIVAHTEMLACLQAIQEANVPELKPVCEKAITMTKQHLEKAHALSETLGKKASIKQ